jgi:hypothetical protein
MNATPLPLPLELAKPMLLAGDLDTQIRTTIERTAYDPTMQMGGCGCYYDTESGTENSSEQETESSSGFLVIDVSIDGIQVDSVLVDDIAADYIEL